MILIFCYESRTNRKVKIYIFIVIERKSRKGEEGGEKGREGEIGKRGRAG